MRTDDLIQSLAADTPAVSRHAVERRVAIGLVGGGLVTAGLVMGGMGVRSDLHKAMHGFDFWMKWTYTASLAALAIAAVLHVARPDAGRARWLWLIALPLAIVALLSAGELMHAPPSHWMPMWLGHSWRQCSTDIVVLSLPVFAGLLWAFRALAPIHLRAAGAAAGLAAGATGATLYGLYCTEITATFVVTWYTLGMAVAAAIGALVGPRLMRW